MAQFTLDGVTYSRFQDIPGAVYTRSGVEYQQNAAGVWAPFDDDVPPRSDGVGVDVWEGRTNSIRNPTGLGAVAGVIGSGGALPTNWATAAQTGLTRSVALAGPVNGLPTVDIRFNGINSSGSAQQLSIDLENLTQIAASVGQVWTLPVRLAVVGGAFPTGACELWIAERNAGGGLLTTNSLNLKPLVGASLGLVTSSATLSQASTAFVQPTLRFSVANGETYDFTIRIAAPNLKLGANIGDPPILQTTNAAATRGNPAMYINAPSLLNAPFTVQVWFKSANVVAASEFRRPFSIDDGTTSNICDIYLNPGQAVRAFVLTGGVLQADFGTRTFTPGALVKAAVRFKTDSVAMSVNGLAVESDTSATLAAQYARIRFGANVEGLPARYLNGAIQRFRILGDTTDAELQALTA